MSTSSHRPVRGRPTGPTRNSHARRRARTLLLFGVLLLVTVIVLLISLAL